MGREEPPAPEPPDSSALYPSSDPALQGHLLPQGEKGSAASVMDLTWLRDFEALAESGNFSRAAEARHVTQPAFSRRVRALEEWAGTALFERTSQPIALTEAGLRLRPLLADIVRRLDFALEEAGVVAEGSLRFAATHALSFSFFPAWLRTHETSTAAAIHLISDGLEACERLMLAGRADFLLCHQHEAVPGLLAEPAFLSRLAGRDRLRLVCAPDPEGAPRFGGSDPAAPILGYGEGSGLARIVAHLAPRHATPVFTSHLAATLRTMALGASGLAWLPQSLIEADLADGRLVAASADLREIPVDIRLLRPAAGGSRAARAFWANLPGEPD